MESVVEDVEDLRETEGSPANSQSCKKLGGWDVWHSQGVDRSCGAGVFSFPNQLDDDIDSEANNKINL